MPIYKGDGNNNIIFGSQTDDTIYGYGGDDTLIGGGGDDTIVGGIGKDTMDGGSGDDVYYVDNVSDVVVENANKGKDIIYSSVTYSLANWAGNVEELILTGSADIDGHGNDLDNGIAGNSGDNDLFGLNGNDTLKGFGGDDFLDGGSGSDIMVGGTGDDYFVVDSFFDDITEYTGEGIDTVSSSVTYTLDPNVEKLILTGSSKIDGYGNQLNNELTGNSADNYLFGGGGADIMKGGDGGDDYYLDNVNDVVVEFADQGLDMVFANFSYTLGANVEHLHLYDSANIDGFGNGADNIMTGNAGNNALYGGGGDDTLSGNEGHDKIVGGIGNDKMSGGGGDDVYYVDNVNDVIVEYADKGNDTVYSTVNHTLSDHVETLSLIVGNAVQGTGNSQHNTIFGNGNDNVLNGGGANDILSGLGGNDTFLFQAGQANGDVVYEFEGNGAGLGDVLKFSGYGTAAQGATFIQQTATEWFITSADGTIQEVITLIGAPTVDPTDYVFV